MGIRAAGPGTPVTDEQRIRYQPCVNVSSYDAPPFAAMARAAVQLVDGANVWSVFRPTAEHEVRQNATDIVFNGPEVLPAGKTGRCTVDFPARCLHLKSDTIFANVTTSSTGGFQSTYFVGPKADSWLLWSGGSAFTWLSAGDMQDANFESGLVTLPVPSYYGASFNIGTSLSGNVAANIPVNGIIGYATGINPINQDGYWILITQDNRIPFAIDFLTVTPSAFNQSHSGSNYLQIPKTGIYEWHFSCTAIAAGAPQGTPILIQTYVDDFILPEYVLRIQQNEIDNYGATLNRSSENMAMTGVSRFTAGETLNFRNLSTEIISVSAGFARVRRIQ